MEAEIEKTQKELLAASRQAGMVEIAAGVIRNVGNILKNANISAGLVSDQVKQSKIANVVHVGNLIREHVKDLGDFMARDPRGQKLPVYIAQLADHLANEQTTLSKELESLRKKHRGSRSPAGKLHRAHEPGKPRQNHSPGRTIADGKQHYVELSGLARIQATPPVMVSPIAVETG